MTKEEYFKYFKHMEEENNKCMLGGMAWDDICWSVHEAVNEHKYFTIEELHKLFPDLFK